MAGRCIDGASSLVGSPWQVAEHNNFPIYGSDDDTFEKLKKSPNYNEPTPFEQLSLSEAARIRKDQ